MKNWIECGFETNDKEKSQMCLWLNLSKADVEIIELWKYIFIMWGNVKIIFI